MLYNKLLRQCDYHLTTIHKYHIINSLWDLLINNIEYIDEKWLDIHFYEGFNCLNFSSVTTDEMKDIQTTLKLGKLTKKFNFNGTEVEFNSDKEYLGVKFQISFTFNTPKTCEIQYKEVETEIHNITEKDGKFFKKVKELDKVVCSDTSMIRALNKKETVNAT